MNRWHVIATGLCGIAVSVVALSGLSKLLDLGEFARQIRAWGIFSEPLVAALVALVPAIETGTAGLWLIGIARRRVTLVLIGMVVSMTFVMAAVWLFHEPPSNCGCFGVLGEWLRVSTGFPAAMTRNAALLGALTMGLIVKDRRSCPKHAEISLNAGVLRTTRGGCSNEGHGFTLIETVLVIALVGVLIVLLTPSLRGVRRAGDDAGAAAHLRSHASVFAMYASDHKQLLPNFFNPKADVFILRCPSRGIAIPVHYFEVSYSWGVGLADGYYEGNPAHPSFYSPAARGGRWSGGFLSSYQYACVFLADPDYWDPRRSRLEPEQLRAVRIDEVLFPSSKTLHVNRDRVARDGDDARRIGRESPLLPDLQASFIDGHAEIMKGDRQNRDSMGCWRRGSTGPWGIHTFPNPHLTHTLSGAHGRDIR